MEGLGERCREIDGCSGSSDAAQYQRTDLVPRGNEACYGAGCAQRGDSDRGSVLNGQAGSTLAMGCNSGRAMRNRNSNVADFYCPIADSMEWIDGQDSPAPSPPKDLEKQHSDCDVRLPGPSEMQSERATESRLADKGSAQISQLLPLTNGLHSKNSVLKPGRQHLRNWLGCASYQPQEVSMTVNAVSASHNAHSGVSEIRIGNSCFYVPSAVCSTDKAICSVNIDGSSGSGIEKCVKSLDKNKLPNGWSLGNRSIKFVNRSSSHSRKSWPNSDSPHDLSRTGTDQSHKIKASVSGSASADKITSLRNAETLSSAQSAKTFLGSICHERECKESSQTLCTAQTMNQNTLHDSTSDQACAGVFETSAGAELKSSDGCNVPPSRCVNACNSEIPRNDSSESSEMLDFYDDGVFLEERSPLGENVDSLENYGACGVSYESEKESDKSQCIESRTCNNGEGFCDIEACSSSYNFLDMSVSTSSSNKYCEKNKHVEQVFFETGCSASCDNNEDLGDFIEADIPQHVDRLSSPSGSRASTSSNDEDNILSCQDLNRLGSSINGNGECWESSKYEGRSAFVDEDTFPWYHHPQEADLGKDGVFFSYAPNHNPSLIPGMFRRDSRNCFSRWVGGGNIERKPSDLLSDVYAHRQCPRPRGRSDSSSIAKQSSSDSEISNLAFSDSSVLISPEMDMMGFDLLVTTSDVDRVALRDGASYNSANGCDASSGTLQRNSSEEGFHEALEEELGTCFISGAHASGNCCCPNDLSGSSPIHANGHHNVNLVSPSAAADSSSLNFQVRNPCLHHYEDNKVDGDEACVLTYDENHRVKAKSKSQRRVRSSQQAMCRDNRCERSGGAPVHVKVQGLETVHTNNIVGEERRSPQGEECCSATASTTSQRLPLLCLPGSATDPEGVDDNSEEIGETKELYKFGGKLKKVCKEPLDRVMIWNECEAYFHQMKPVLSAPCGPMAVLNMLKALGHEVSREYVSRVIVSQPRDEAAPIPEYLFSRGVAGTTAEALIEGVVKLTDGAIIGRFFQFYPPREVELLKWLAYWINKGAVPIATLNLQKNVRGFYGIPDAWHHQMVYGVSSKGVHVTNPMEVVSEESLLEQLCSESVLLVRRQDIVSRFDDRCQLALFLQQPDSRWQTMNVLGQVVNVLREETKIPGYRAQVTSHVSIPAVYLSGITLYMPEESSNFTEMITIPDLPIAKPNAPETQSTAE